LRFFLHRCELNLSPAPFYVSVSRNKCKTAHFFWRQLVRLKVSAAVVLIVPSGAAASTRRLDQHREPVPGQQAPYGCARVEAFYEGEKSPPVTLPYGPF